MAHINDFGECHCPICGKTFIPAPMHRYVLHNQKICSWHCLCAYRNKDKGRQGVKDVGRIVHKDKDGNVIEEWRDMNAFLEATGKSIYTAKHLIYGTITLKDGSYYEKPYDEKKGRYKNG